MRLTLHIGHPKTGTTALQSVLAGNSDALLKEAGIYYPTSAAAGFKHALVIPWLMGIENAAIQRRSGRKGSALRVLSKRYWQSLCNQISSVAPEHLVLSAEGFWMLRQATPASARFFRDSLRKIASHICVVGYLRSPAPYFASKLNQKLRNYRPVHLPNSNYYRPSIEAWESLEFDQYHWRIYDRRSLINGDIVDDFCSHHLAPQMDTNHLRRIAIEKANDSVSNEALVILEELVIRYPVLRGKVDDPWRSNIVRILRTADRMLGGNHRPSLNAWARSAMIQRAGDLPWLGERGLHFPDIDPAEIGGGAAHETCTHFTQVADFCVIDAERLTRLHAAVNPPIEALLWSRSQRQSFQNST